MKLLELFEGKVKDLAINRDYDRQYGRQPAPTVKLPVAQYYVSINGKKWKEFSSEKLAMAAANAIYNKNPKLKVDVLPLKSAAI